MWAAVVMAVAAEPAFHALFRGAAVLQHGAPARVWGTDASARVELLLDGEAVATAEPDAAGNWSASLPPQPPAYNRTLAIRGAAATATVSFGEVVLCSGESPGPSPHPGIGPLNLTSGQSNMGMNVGGPLLKGNNGHVPFAADNGTAESAASGVYAGESACGSTTARTACRTAPPGRAGAGSRPPTPGFRRPT